MRNLTLEMAPFSDDPELIRRLAALRDRKIADLLADKKTIAYRAGMWAKATLGGDPEAARWCRAEKIAITKASATQPNSVGGFLVPDEVAATVILLLEQYGVARSEAETWPMTSDEDNVPRSTAGFTAGWIAEGARLTEGAAAFDGVGLIAKKLGALAKISTELLDDAGEKLGRFLIAGMAQAFAKAEDDAAFAGDGTSTYGGVRGIATLMVDGNHNAGKITAASSHSTFATLDSSDIGNAIAALPKRALANAKIYVSLVGYGATLCRLAGANGGLVATVGADGKLNANWHGLAVVITQSLPTGTGSLSGKVMMAIGDMRQAVALGARRDLTLQRFDQTFAELDQVLIRATERVDIVAHDLGDNSSAGAMVALVGN